MLWLCLLPSGGGANAPPWPEALQASWVLLGFTPRVCIQEGAVLAEVSGSLRLFGGFVPLVGHINAACLGLSQVTPPEAQVTPSEPPGIPPTRPEPTLWQVRASAPTALAALAQARGRVRPTRAEHSLKPGAPGAPHLLDALPLHCLSAAAAQSEMLQQVGLRTLGQVRALPRGPLARRFGAPLLLALDQAYGLKPEVHDWLCLPDVFDERLELPSRIDDAAQLLFAAQLLLARLHAWLLARRAGATAIELRWRHDFAARSAGEGGALQVRTAQAARDVVHLGRLLRERLNATTLGGPVGEIALRVLAWEPLAEMSGSFLPDPLAQGEGLQQLLERLGERLGATQVLRASLQDDWRLHHAQVWREAAGILAKVQVRAVASLEHAAALPVWPTFVLPEPLPLLVKRHVPHYQGPLVLLAGPERVESVWWEVSADQVGAHPTGKTPDPTTQRDYFLAYSSNAGLLWIYKERLPDAQRQDDSFQWALAGMLA